MRNNKILCVALLAAGVCVASTGYAALNGAYTTAQVGVAGLGFNDEGPYFHFALGDQLNHYFAVEGGVTAIPTTSGGGSGFLSDGVAHLYSLDGDVKAMLPLDDRVNLYAKAGPSLAYFKKDYGDDHLGVMANVAVGVAFNVTEHWTTDFSVGAMVGDGAGVSTMQLGLGYHFA